MQIESEIIDGIARALFVDAWANKQERQAQQGRRDEYPYDCQEYLLGN